jgi:hypothetical protein
MPISNPSDLAKGSAALKAAFENFRTAIAMVHDLRSLGDISEQEQRAIDDALKIASSNSAIAEAEIAKALGYELCKCDFPPTPMKTVGYFTRPVTGKAPGDPVYECQTCGYNTAGPWMYQRIAPERAQ